MADIQEEVRQLRQHLASLETTVRLQQTDARQLRRQMATSKAEIEALIATEIANYIQGQLPDIITQIHPNLGMFLSLFEGKSGGDLQNFAADIAPLITGENAEISPQQLDQLWQNVRVLIHDTIHQQVSQILARHVI